MDTKNKILGAPELMDKLKKNRHSGKRIVTVSGSFDILHSGHIHLLETAAGKGDVLAVLLNSDRSVSSYKGPNRPIVNEQERARMLAAVQAVDYVTLFDELNPNNILKRIRPDIHCNGSEWGKNCVEREVVEKYGGQIAVIKLQKGLSTSALIRSIMQKAPQGGVKAVFLDRDGTINLNNGGYIHKREDFEYAPGAVAAMKKIAAAGYLLFIITNQSGIGRKYYKRSDFLRLNSWMLSDLQSKGIKISKVYYCPHAPEDKCSCRKPETGLLLRAVREFKVSLNKSWIIGDDDRDVICGRRANLRTIKLGAKMKNSKLQPKHYAKDLRQAAEIILGRK